MWFVDTILKRNDSSFLSPILPSFEVSLQRAITVAAGTSIADQHTLKQEEAPALHRWDQWNHKGPLKGLAEENCVWKELAEISNGAGFEAGRGPGVAAFESGEI